MRVQTLESLHIWWNKLKKKTAHVCTIFHEKGFSL
jgi:hypothetical protein